MGDVIDLPGARTRRRTGDYLTGGEVLDEIFALARRRLPDLAPDDPVRPSLETLITLQRKEA